MTCPPKEHLELLLSEGLDRANLTRIEEHLESCGSCQTLLDELSKLESSKRSETFTASWQPLELQPRPEFLHKLRTEIPVCATDVTPIQSDSLTISIDSHNESPITAPKWPVLRGYQIEAELGRGGIAVVYRARHLALGRNVALKVILAGAHAGTEERRRFRDEAAAVARLQHTNIVQVFEVGEEGGCPYLSLEYVDGGTLAHKLRIAVLSVHAAAELTETLARAVHVAHRRGIVHRDLKPANILMTGDGTPKVADFGLAKHLDIDQKQTQTGAVIGTPSYMAPEQAAGRGHG